MSIDDLIADIAGNDMVNATKKFDSLMSDRLNAALDAKKIELAKSIGEEEAPEIEEVETDDETLEAESEETSEEETETEAEEGNDEEESDEEVQAA